MCVCVYVRVVHLPESVDRLSSSDDRLPNFLLFLSFFLFLCLLQRRLPLLSFFVFALSVCLSAGKENRVYGVIVYYALQTTFCVCVCVCVPGRRSVGRVRVVPLSLSLSLFLRSSLSSHINVIHSVFRSLSLSISPNILFFRLWRFPLSRRLPPKPCFSPDPRIEIMAKKSALPPRTECNDVDGRRVGGS